MSETEGCSGAAAPLHIHNFLSKTAIREADSVYNDDKNNFVVYNYVFESINGDKTAFTMGLSDIGFPKRVMFEANADKKHLK